MVANDIVGTRVEEVEASVKGRTAEAEATQQAGTTSTNLRRGKKGRTTQFDRAALSDVKSHLLAQREGLLEQLREIEEAAFNASQSELSGEVAYDEDSADAGSFTFEREKDLSIAQNVQDLLDKIAKALQKIEGGSYGICESCGEPIEAARMNALPHALLCIRCKRAEERR